METVPNSRVSIASPSRSRVTVVALRRLPLREALGRVVVISLVITTLIFAGLTLQMSVGGDPALGSKVSGQSTSSSSASSATTTTASSGGSDTSAISAALAAQAQIATPTPTPVSPSSAVPATPSPPPTPVQTSTS